MGADDTSLGGLARNFPTTHWSNILAAADPTSPHCRRSLDELLRAYWKPVYAYVRTAWGKTVDDAKDLTQAFFAHMLSKEGFARVQPDRGNFRGYLKRALKNFVIDAYRAEASRRPQDGPIVSLDAVPEEFASLGPAAPDEPPEHAYDRAWFRSLLEASLDALKETLTREGKAIYFEVFRVYCLDPHLPADPASGTVIVANPPEPPTYRDVAERLELTEWDVQNYLAHARDLLRAILRERIRAYVAGDDDVERELGEVLNR